MALQWLWMEASNLLWAHYGVSSKIGRWCDAPRGGVPLGKVSFNEFVMLGDQHPERPQVKRFTYERRLHSKRAPKRMSAELHEHLGRELKLALESLGAWDVAKTHRRSIARVRLRRYFDTLRCIAHGLAHAEHGEVSWSWYYNNSGAS